MLQIAPNTAAQNIRIVTRWDNPNKRLFPPRQSSYAVSIKRQRK